MQVRVGDKIVILAGPFEGGCADIIEAGQTFAANINTIHGLCTVKLFRHEFSVLWDYVDGATMTKFLRDASIDGTRSNYRPDYNWEYRPEDYNG